MTRTRKWIIAFWIFIGFMLLWQFYDYDKGLTQEAAAHPKQQQFFFYHTNAAPIGPTVVQHKGAYVEQTRFTVEQNVPGTGSITCHVTATNKGLAKATGVEISVHPYRGTRLGDEDVGRSPLTNLPDSDPRAQLNQWVPFPDLDPGESNTQSVVFISQSGVTPGGNPKPDILFQAEVTNPHPGSTLAPEPSQSQTAHPHASGGALQ
jgi:hypothetical protein